MNISDKLSRNLNLKKKILGGGGVTEHTCEQMFQMAFLLFKENT